MWYGSWQNPKNLAGCRPGPVASLPFGADTRPTKGSYPLGDSDAPSALRYAQAGRAQDQWGTDLVTVGIEVKKK